ncbi:FAD-binding protein [Kitasatospora purpeofusca]|uniref:FAD-binding protein n=1 Tax=Kitasatospora purpeofusca TaxID=67352 RepID=UPI00224C8ABA|nr:FAD-binding protein [Kitasatospora purpeofusca]MCX4755668.1 FAD-binding protein [Kitasatospora purpeofusca]WSR36470.1 FAD-binding protein [Kitasatospora purpeofusca]
MSKSALPRRSVIVGAAATVVGWNTVGRSWAVEAADPEAATASATASEAASDAAAGTASGADALARLPHLDGTLVADTATLARFGGDFGHLVTAAPRAVLRPGSVRDVATLVGFARRHRIPVAMNGQSGTGDAAELESHSSYGQAGVRGGVAIDSRGLDRIIRITPGRAVVEAGVTWAQLTDAALAKGWMPPSLTDYLHLSVGGTLSVGGIGGGVQRYGFQVDTVESVDVVTGTGELVTASASANRELFEAVLGGGGQAGLIVRATLRLVRARERALVLNLFYDDLGAYLADQKKVMLERRFDLQVGDVSRNAAGTGWRYKVEGVVHYDGTAAPDRAKLVRGLRCVAADTTFTDQTAREYAYRVDAFAGFLKGAGLWSQPKPWMSLFLPASATETFMREATALLTPEDLGAGLLLFYPFRTDVFTRPMTVMPDEPVGFHFDLLSFPFPGADHAAALRRNRRLYDRAVQLGGKRYLIGAIPDVTHADWRHHYGSRWGRVVAAKRRFDPAGILTPGQGIHS